NALKDFFTSTGGSTWTNKSNWPTTWPASATAAQMDTWYGVVVTGGDVTSLTMTNNNLQGTLPASLNNLTSLLSFYVSINKLTGTLPDFGGLTKMHTLRVDQNLFTGEIPASYASLATLQHLYLYDNDLSGDIPAWLGDQSNLLNLYLQGNEFTGTIPASLSKLNKLQRLHLGGNNLTGAIPSELGRLSALVELGLSGNQLTGSIPPELGELSELIHLHLYSNSLSGSLPASLGNLHKLLQFYLWQNQLTGSIPDTYAGMTSLQSFQVYLNQLSGEIPPAVVGAWTNILNIQIHNNLFSGAFPATVSNCINLTYIRAASNKFTSIPESILSTNLSKLVYLNFQYNELTAIPNLATHVNKAKLDAYFQYNFIDFDSWEPIFTNAGGHGLKTLGYSPQKKFNGGKIYQPAEGTLVIKPSAGKGQSGVVKWEKKVGSNWTVVGGNDYPYQVPNVTTAANGIYRWTLTLLPISSLTLQSDDIEVVITDPLHGTNNVKALYNGMITAVRWRTDKVYESNDEEFKGQYTYTYDDKYQIKEGNWADPGKPTQPTNFFRLSNMSYDANGNIKSLLRHDKDGVRTNDFSYNYAYEQPDPEKKNNNLLKSVTGYVNVYQYNALGQMIGEDKVTGDDQYIEYDVSGKVTKVFSDASKTKLKVEYLYDDRGFRLAKNNYSFENNAAKLTHTTWYIRDGSGNVINILEENFGAEPSLNVMEIPVYGSGKVGTYYPQQDGSVNYELTDHLGNVRALVRDNVSVYTATLEDTGLPQISNPRVSEDVYFKNLTETEVQDTRMNHSPVIPGVVDNPNRSSYLYWVDGMQGMEAADKSIGPATVLKVSNGDKVDLEAYVKYEKKESFVKDVTPIMLASFLTNSFAYAGGFEGYTLAQTTQNLTGALTSGFFPDDSGTETLPFAYLNYIVYDKNMGIIKADRKRVSTAAGFLPGGETSTSHEHLQFGTVNITAEGYIYVWVSNQSEATKVWFDDLTVKHAGAVVTQATDYGIWGDVIRDSGSPNLLESAKDVKKSLVGQYLFNGDAADLSSGINGTVSGATLIAGSDGAANSAYNFDGVDDKITLPNSEDEFAFIQNTGVFTITAFIKLNDLSARSMIVGSVTTSANKGFAFAYDTYGGIYGDHQLSFRSTHGTVSTFNLAKGTYQFSDTEWHHVAVVGDGKQVTFYVDGVQDGSSKVLTYYSTGASTWPTVIGASNDGYGNTTLPMNGAIDDLHIFDRALAAAEISELSNRKDVESEYLANLYRNQYRYGYQGKFSEKDLETGWNHFQLREYESTMGRWLAVDPKRQFSSPYIGMGNNPVNSNDRDGGEVCFDAQGRPIPCPDVTGSRIQGAKMKIGLQIVGKKQADFLREYFIPGGDQLTDLWELGYETAPTRVQYNGKIFTYNKILGWAGHGFNGGQVAVDVYDKKYGQAIVDVTKWVLEARGYTGPLLAVDLMIFLGKSQMPEEALRLSQEAKSLRIQAYNYQKNGHQKAADRLWKRAIEAEDHSNRIIEHLIEEYRAEQENN
ncbi:MAG: LamG-like jellyroll fold domain-containing protein, partial [Bacteroidota bacterium]